MAITLEDEVYEVIRQAKRTLTDSEITDQVKRNRAKAERRLFRKLLLTFFSSLTVNDVAMTLGQMERRGRVESRLRRGTRTEWWEWGLPRTYAK